MQTISQNFTVDDLDTSLQFVFRNRDADFSTGMFVIRGISYVAASIFFVVAIFYVFPQLWQNAKDLSKDLFFFLFLLLLLLFNLWGVANTFVEIFWRLNGKEIVVINSNGISIHHQVLSFGITKNFSAEKISCIFISRHKDHWFIMRFYTFKRGKIAFNSGKTFLGTVNTLRFGSILGPDETRQVIAIIHQRYPQYRCLAKSAG